MWASLTNLFCAALLMYGVSMKAPRFMIPWLITSVTCYITSFAVQVFGHYNAIPNVYITWKILGKQHICDNICMLIIALKFILFLILKLDGVNKTVL